MKRILFVGDIVGKPGRVILENELEEIIKENQIDIVLANVENAAGGFGCNVKIHEQIKEFGVDIQTSGNHIFDQKEMQHKMDNLKGIIRPYNYPAGNPGKGYLIAEKNGVKYAVLNLLGRVFTSTVDCPFVKGLEAVNEIKAKGIKNIFVDFHAETTSEKIALGYYLDGKVTAVLGTHTHVATADEEILGKRTPYQTDVGMTGFKGGVLGFDKSPIIEKFLTQTNRRFNVPDHGKQILQATVVTFDENSGESIEIKRIQKVT